MSDATIELRGLPETKELLEQFEGRALNNRMRRALRAGAKVMREEMRRQARARGDIPDTFARTRTRAHRTPLGVSVSPQSPLSSIFEGGADPHAIGASGQLLHSQQGEAPFVARGPVSHPGMDARPFIGPVFEAARERSGDAAEAALFEGIR